MTVLRTKEIRYVRLPERRIREIEALVDSWSFEIKSFMRSRLHQYKPPNHMVRRAADRISAALAPDRDRRFTMLGDPAILSDWQMRFSVSGRTNPLDAWNKVLEKEISARDYAYILYLLDQALADAHVPVELETLFEKAYRAFIRKEYVTDPALPKCPLILFIGPTGSGKTVTASRIIQEVIFTARVVPEIDIKQKAEELLADQPFWKTIEEIDPEFAAEIQRQKKLHFYKRLSKTPLLNRIFKKRIGRNLLALEEQGMLVDFAVVTPNDYQTAFAGEPGNFFKRAMGEPDKTSIRHIEEAHSAFGRADGRMSGAERQQSTLVDTSNIIIDEIIGGRRDCLLIATTDKPEIIDTTIYRRFMEKGKIIDISEFWKNPVNLKEVVRLELLTSDIRTAPKDAVKQAGNFTFLPEAALDRTTEQVYAIFRERTLKITPAYVRKLISSVIEIKGGFAPAYLDESLLVRRAFELVAQNLHGDLFEKIVNTMDRKITWEEYIGSVKDMFSEMANNSLFYGASEEKGVVLNGPPGSGKTYLARSWLSENPHVHDMATSHSALQDPMNPLDGAVSNLEKVYDIAKMIAPTMVFFDEGDSLAPRRSATGGSPADRLTNKFLNLIDGEVPLNRVFTVLTTNRLDILDPALIRSKRLKVMEISGHLGKEDIHKIIHRHLTAVPLAPGLDADAVLAAAGGICNTPADFTAFMEKVLSLRRTEYEALRRFQAIAGETGKERENFIKLNIKTLVGVLAAAGIAETTQGEIKDRPERFLTEYQKVEKQLSGIGGLQDYPLVASHLKSARREISQSPVKKGAVQLSEYLEAELSREPQVGFIIGVGANDVSGMLLPIATSLTYTTRPEKIVVTGAVSSGSAMAAELDMAVQMTKQSAKEALTMVENYFQSLCPRLNITRVIGEFFRDYCLHHQLLSTSYTVGGPSAGYALAINTLSVLLQIPVYHDFGITGAPWTKGVRRGEVGSSVIIGGHKKKAEKILLHLRRMYMPRKNYDDLEKEYLLNYWNQDKDIIGVTHFGDLVPEVICLGRDHEQKIADFIGLRIAHKRQAFQGGEADDDAAQTIAAMKADLRKAAEQLVVERLSAIQGYLRNPEKDPYLSIEELFRRQGVQATEETEQNSSTGLHLT